VVFRGDRSKPKQQNHHMPFQHQPDHHTEYDDKETHPSQRVHAFPPSAKESKDRPRDKHARHKSRRVAMKTAVLRANSSRGAVKGLDETVEASWWHDIGDYLQDFGASRERQMKRSTSSCITSWNMDRGDTYLIREGRPIKQPR
jgi:hypothetical protein